MSVVTVSQRQLDELTMGLGRAQDELAAAARRESALERRLLEQLTAIGNLESVLAVMAEKAFPPGVEQMMGEEWTARWRTKAHQALAEARVFKAAA